MEEALDLSQDRLLNEWMNTIQIINTIKSTKINFVIKATFIFYKALYISTHRGRYKVHIYKWIVVRRSWTLFQPIIRRVHYVYVFQTRSECRAMVT